MDFLIFMFVLLIYWETEQQTKELELHTIQNKNTQKMIEDIQEMLETMKGGADSCEGK